MKGRIFFLTTKSGLHELIILEKMCQGSNFELKLLHELAHVSRISTNILGQNWLECDFVMSCFVMLKSLSQKKKFKTCKNHGISNLEHRVIKLYKTRG